MVKLLKNVLSFVATATFVKLFPAETQLFQLMKCYVKSSHYITFLELKFKPSTTQTDNYTFFKDYFTTNQRARNPLSGHWFAIEGHPCPQFLFKVWYCIIITSCHCQIINVVYRTLEEFSNSLQKFKPYIVLFTIEH